MANAEHVYDVPSEDELAQLVGAATPHFALQIKARIALLADRLPGDHPRQAELRRQMDRMERLATGGEAGHDPDLDLPPRPPLSSVAPRGAARH